MTFIKRKPTVKSENNQVSNMFALCK